MLYMYANMLKINVRISKYMTLTPYSDGLDGPCSFTGVQDFLLSTASRPTLGPTQPPVQWVPAARSPEIKRQGREADHSPATTAEVKKVRAIPPLPRMSSWHCA
jgi:hypothetical protein